MRIALAQVNVTVGDFNGAIARCLAAVREAADAGADLVVLPELALTGYPPEDLLHRPAFVERSRSAVWEFAREAAVPAVVGFVDVTGGALHNAAAVCADGRVTAIYRKRLLPNYGVFDEERYFEPGDTDLVIALGGLPCAITICEDIWSDDTAARLAAAGARLVVNLSASPFHTGKASEREAMLQARAADHGLWVAYCNLVGGQDELVFDGRSVVIAPDGTVVARGAAFTEDVVLAEIDAEPAERYRVMPGGLTPSPEGLEDVYGALTLGLGDYVRKNGFTDVALGLSGGIDSAFVAVLATDALGPDHVHGVLMPGPYSSEGSVADARALAENLGIDTRTLPIDDAFAALGQALEAGDGAPPAGLAAENLQARVRGALLMALSNTHGWLVLATSNKSESAVGYSTLYGDMVGGFAPVKDVYKTRLYDLARWRNTLDPVIPEASLAKPPSAELRPDQTDQDSLPPYEVLDAVLAGYIEGELSAADLVAAGHDAEIVAHVVRLVDAAEYKRRQSAPGTRVTTKAFGRDRRMPITNRFRS
jgi:NAD+ synthase (glutamine-hydrolysing)